MDVDAVLGRLYELIAPHLTEKQRRLLAGATAMALGRGGGARMARISGLSRPTVYAGMRELADPPDPRGRVRRPGGGPKRLTERNPGLLDELVDPDTRGDPESPLRWDCAPSNSALDRPFQGAEVREEVTSGPPALPGREPEGDHRMAGKRGVLWRRRRHGRARPA